MPGGWSVKDVLAHLAWWDRWLVYTLQVDGADPARPGPPLLDQIPPGDRWADQLNTLVFEHNRDRELGEVQAEFELALRRVVQALYQLAPEDVFGAGARSAAIGQAVGPLVFGIYEHYDEHSHEIEAVFQSDRDHS